MPHSEPSPGEARSDHALLRSFVEGGVERDFEELVRRHAGLVLAVAKRRTASPHLAEDVAQQVFAILIRKARRLLRHPSLAGWLHKTTSLEAARLMRKERTHRRTLSAFAAEPTREGQGGQCHPATDQIDGALAALSPTDREFLLLRFYQGYQVREIAARLGKSEVAARKQSERALERLAKILRRRHAEITTASLIALLGSAFSAPIRGAVIESLAAGAPATAVSLSSPHLFSNTILTMTYGKQIGLTAAVLVALAAIPLTIQSQRIKSLESQVEQARGQSSNLPTLSLARGQGSPRSAHHASKAETPDHVKLRALLTQNPRPAQDQINQFIGERRSASELQAMFDGILSLPATEHQQVALSKILFELAKLDGERAVRLTMKSIKAPSFRQDALGAAYRGWGSHDASAAWAFTKTLSPEEQTKHPKGEIIFGTALGDVSDAYQFIESHASELPRYTKRLWHTLTHLYIHKDSQGMPGWVETLPSGYIREIASGQLVQRWARSDPQAARVWMEEHVDMASNTLPTYELVRSWALTDPQAAVEWLSALPPEHQEARHYSGLFQRWLGADQLAAARWLADAEPSPMLDEPFEQFAGWIMNSNPAEAMTWASSITDSERRAKAIGKVRDSWAQRDPDSFAEFLKTEQKADRPGRE